MKSFHPNSKRLSNAVIALALLMLHGCVPAPRKTDAAGEPEPVHVLCLASEDTEIQGLDSIEPEALEMYKAQGIHLELDYYQRITPDKLRRYPVVIGMIPGLHAGTQAIPPELGKEILAYVRDGGGFLLIPGPSYYMQTDFITQLNPWLEPLGAKLLAEHPRDPENQTVQTRLLNYRYLKTANIAESPITQGVESLWLPLDYMDGLLRTHTMAVDDTWSVLVRGEASCRTFTFDSMSRPNPQPGTHSSAPPFLATRKVGKGEFAIFTTASHYFIFDAGHWAYGNGFVLNNGDGMRLMANLIRQLGKNAPLSSEGDVDTVETTEKVIGNVAVYRSKPEWLEHVLSERKPAGYGVRTYIDCGSLRDLPFSEQRGYGYIPEAVGNWQVRWAWAERYHVTAANSRGFDIRPLVYRFAKLTPERTYKLGVLVWAYQTEGTRAFSVEFNGTPVQQPIAPPRFTDHQGPRFLMIDIPASLDLENTLDIAFKLTGDGTGSFSSVCELWLFEENGPQFTSEEIISVFESPSAGADFLPFERENAVGLIGALPSAPSALEVKSFAEAARAEGLDFLVFTPSVAEFNQDEFDRFRTTCAQASDDRLAVVPGIRFESTPAPQRIPTQPQSFGSIRAAVYPNARRLPDSSLLSNPYKLLWSFFGGELCGGRKTRPTLLTPDENGISPFHQRFWRGFDVKTLAGDGTMTSDADDLFVDLLDSGYFPYPRVSYDLHRPSDVSKAMENWRVFWPKPPEAETMPYNYGSGITNGPRLKIWSVSSDYSRDCRSGEGFLLNRPGWLRLAVGIEADSPLSQVTVYDGSHVVRRWYPDSREFSIADDMLATGRHDLWLHAKTVDGKELIAGSCLVEQHEFGATMCADNQNTITNLGVPPDNFEGDERDMYIPHSYWHTGGAGGQLGMMKPLRDVVPRVIETGIAQPIKHFIPMPLVYLADGTVEDHYFAELRILSSSRNHYVVEYSFDTPASKTSSQVKLTSFRPRIGGGTVIMIESRLTAKTTVQLADSKTPIRLLSLGMMPVLPPNWKLTVETEDKKHPETVAFAELPQNTEHIFDLRDHGALAAWPSDAGNVFVKLLNAEHAVVMAKNAVGFGRVRETIEVSTQADSLAAGTVLVNRLLVALDVAEADSADILAELDRLYDVRSLVADIHTGKLLDTTYPATFASENGGVRFRLHNAQNHRNPVPVVVQGLPTNATALATCAGRNILLQPDEQGIARVVLSPENVADSAEVVIGCPVIVDTNTVKVSWGGKAAGGIRLHVHNPTAAPVRVRLTSNPVFKNLPEFTIEVQLDPGESQWLWCKGKTVVTESEERQVGSTASR